MGYYDDQGNYHSFRDAVHRAADRIRHPLGGREIDLVISKPHHHHHHHRRSTVEREPERSSEFVSTTTTREASGPAPAPALEPRYTSTMANTVSIPCNHIRLGDLLILQGRPCQVIRITTSAATGQYRYLGVDLFTKELCEESSNVENPSPNVVVQTMLGPVFMQYRVLDLQDGSVVAMTETGDVKQSLPILDQSNLYSRLSEAFDTGRGSVRVLVINDRGRELVVDMKVIHGSRL